MKAIGILVFALALFTPIFGWRPLSEVFTVKNGKTEGGCDEIEYDLVKTFKEASNLITFALNVFREYSERPPVRKIESSFFAIKMNPEGTGVKDNANQKKLDYVIGMSCSSFLEDTASPSLHELIYIRKYTDIVYTTERLKAAVELVHGQSNVANKNKQPDVQRTWFFCNSDRIKKAKLDDPCMVLHILCSS